MSRRSQSRARSAPATRSRRNASGSLWRARPRGPVGGGGVAAARGAGGWRCWSAPPLLAASRATSCCLNSAGHSNGRAGGRPARRLCLPGCTPTCWRRWAAGWPTCTWARYRAIAAGLLLPGRLGLLASASPTARLLLRRDTLHAPWSPACPRPDLPVLPTWHTYRPTPSLRGAAAARPWPPAPSGAASPLSGPTRVMAEGRGVWEGEG